MTIDEVAGPVMVPIAFGVAIVATVLLILRLARRYPTVPKRVPLRINADGRPSGRSGPKAVLWLAPVILAVLLVVLGVLEFAAPASEHQRVPTALAFLIFAEVAWYVGWALDRQIEMARKMTYRIAPARMLRVALPLLATIAVTVFIAARS